MPEALAQQALPTAWPLDAAEAQRRQTATAEQLGVPVERTVEVGDGVTMALVLVPAGEFVMGAPEGESTLDPDEAPRARLRLERPFYLGRCEVTNQQYACFDPAHDSRFIDTNWKDRVGPGPPLNEPQQPVCRISWHQVQEFCRRLGGRLGRTCRLPTEAEWEYACRAGTDTPFCCGTEGALPRFANFADASLGSLKPWAVRDQQVNDGAAASASVGRYQPNAWGLCDLHGNVAEWCGSVYRPYPYDVADGREDPAATGPRVVRGGSWDDRPRRCRSAFRLWYDPTFAVYNVGFRVLVEP